MAPARARSKPTVVLLVRHGHTATTGKVLPGRSPGLHLDDAGRAQARTVADHLASVNGNGTRIDAVYASPLERARETAAPIARALGLRVRTERGLVEVDTGDWTGTELKAARRRKEWRVIQGHPSGFRFPGGESFLDMQQRMVAAVDRLRAAHPGGALVAVSHADPIKVLAAHALGSHLDLFQRFVISPCSVTTLVWPEDGPPMVLGLNWVPQTVSTPS